MNNSFYTYSDQLNKNHILFHYNKPEWIKLNNIALEIANILDKGKSIEETSEIISLKFNLLPSRAKKDVLYVHEQLKNHFFLQHNNDLQVKRTPVLK